MLGPMFKTGNMLAFAFSINAEKELELPSKIKKRIERLIVLFIFVISIYLYIYGINLLFYFLTMITTYLVLFLNLNYLKNKILYYFAFIFLIMALLGHLTGIVAFEASINPYLDMIMLAIIFLLPYIQYKIVFTDETFDGFVEDYIDFLNAQVLESEYIDEMKRELDEFESSNSLYVESIDLLKNTEKRLLLKTKLDKNKTKIEKKDDLSFYKEKKYKLFLDAEYNKLKRRIAFEERKIEISSELLSFLSGGIAIAGSPKESIIKGIWHFNRFIEAHKEKDFNNYMQEFTKANLGILLEIKNNYLLILYLKFWSNSPDLQNFLNIYKKCIDRKKGAWEKRDKYTPLSDLLKKKIENQIETSNKFIEYLSRSKIG